MEDGVSDDLDGALPALDVPGHGLLALQSLVDGEEVGHLVEDVVGQFGDVLVVFIGGVGEGDGNDLLVVLAVVQHGDVADGVAAHQGQGIQHLGAQHQHVQGVAVVAVGAGDEAVVGGVVGGGVEDAVQDDEAGLLTMNQNLLVANRNLSRCSKRRGIL